MPKETDAVLAGGKGKKKEIKKHHVLLSGCDFAACSRSSEEVFLEERMIVNHKVQHCDGFLNLRLGFKPLSHCTDVCAAQLDANSDAQTTRRWRSVWFLPAQIRKKEKSKANSWWKGEIIVPHLLRHLRSTRLSTCCHLHVWRRPPPPQSWNRSELSTE